MIEKITIKNVATYPPEGVIIDNLKKVNFFFGYNGSGKSTIAKFLHNLSLHDSERNSDFDTCSQIGYDNTKHQILVFDDIFVDNNFNKSDTLKGVFSLNQQNASIDSLITKEQAIIQANETYTKSKKELITKIEEKTKNDSLINRCFQERKIFSSFNKISIEHSGSKVNHLQKLREILQQSPFQDISTIESLSQRYNQLFENEISKIDKTIDVNEYKTIRRVERDLEALLSEIIVGNEDVDIAALIKLTNSRAWVEQGVELLDITSKTCPFCQKETIDQKLLEQFNKYFDTTYKTKVAKLKELKEQYNSLFNRFLATISEIQRKYNPNNITSDLYIKLKQYLENNNKIIDYKILHPNERKSIVSLVETKADISSTNQKIRRNDLDFDEVDKKKRELKDDIWKYMASKSEESIKTFDLRVSKCNRIILLANDLIKLKNGQILSSKQKIEEWQQQTVNTRDAIDKINRILITSGFDGFQIEEKEKINNISQYYLKRNNATNDKPVFKSLSEGEKNFISFLYFYQLCFGTDDIENNSSKKKIIVIDDPVSSLDSNVLFIVSTLIHQLIWRKGHDNKPNKQAFRNENIEQVFILTHNLYFYKEVSFDKRAICTDYWHYKISKNNNTTEITGERNKTITDDYSLLWKTIKKTKGNIPSDASGNIAISNLMRRIIDSYVSFIGLGKDCWGAVLSNDTDDPQYIIKCAFLSSLNDESHGVNPHDSLFYQKIIIEQPQTLFDIFEDIFNTIGTDHYNMMMGIESETQETV